MEDASTQEKRFEGLTMKRNHGKKEQGLSVLFDTMKAAERVSGVKLGKKEELAYVIGLALDVPGIKKPTNVFSQLDVARTVAAAVKDMGVFGEPEADAVAQCSFDNQTFIGWLSQVVGLIEEKERKQ